MNESNFTNFFGGVKEFWVRVGIFGLFEMFPACLFLIDTLYLQRIVLYGVLQLFGDRIIILKLYL